MASDSQKAFFVLNETIQCARASYTIHAQLGKAWSPSNNRIRAPPPQEVMSLLGQEVTSGRMVGHVLDLVGTARAAYSVREASMGTYMSHLRCIVAVCDILRAAVVPASVRTIRRYTAVCNKPVTLRGHLAAWRLLHTVLGHPWAGQGDAFIRAAQAGILRMQAPPPPRKAIRRELALQIVRHCLRSGSVETFVFGILAALAYLHALRVPSELLRQWTPERLKLADGVWNYGPITRKNCYQGVILRRSCV